MLAGLAVHGASGRIEGFDFRFSKGRLAADEMAGGAITVSNAGMHGLAAMASIIVPGQSMILGVGAVRELFRPYAQGAPVLRREVALTLSVDHRVLDGGAAGAAGAGAVMSQVKGGALLNGFNFAANFLSMARRSSQGVQIIMAGQPYRVPNSGAA